jgi:hypothetical protein
VKRDLSLTGQDAIIDIHPGAHVMEPFLTRPKREICKVSDGFPWWEERG